ncbi:MAG: hypothetical protein Q9201_001121 [Fulgogasparrea decipioides]
MSDYGGDDAGDDYEAYEPEEPHYEDEEPTYDAGDDPHDPEQPTRRDGIDEDGADADSKVPNGVVEVGQDASAKREGKKNAVVGLKEKKIPKEERSTTPYMTKYERARVLGTRALQIR